MTKKKSVQFPITETLSVTIPIRLGQQVRACAGYWNKGDVAAWLVESLRTTVEGDLEGMHTEMEERCAKTGSK